jgi:hypothetical protein
MVGKLLLASGRRMVNCGHDYKTEIWVQAYYNIEKVVALAIPNNRIKLQVSTTSQLITIFVPEDAFPKIVKVYSDNMIVVHGVTRPVCLLPIILTIP